jgi:beta-lactamase regulating signal transducer with metallopeptidase domain
MLRTLDKAEHDILLAHERAHLSSHHYLFVSLAGLGAAANPLLRPLATAVTYTVERWADEQAVHATGDRTRVARAVGKAALAAHGTPTALRPATLGFRGILGRRGPLAAAGPVPRRVAALLAPPLTRRPGLTLATTALLALTVISTVAATNDLHELLELVGIAHHGPHHLGAALPTGHAAH